jgi:hypothetical protein
VDFLALRDFRTIIGSGEKPMFTLDPAFVRPSYDENCFTALPASIGPLLGAPGLAALPDGFHPGRSPTFRAAVLILLDGFGWRFFEKVADDYPLLRRFTAASGVAKLTSQFPSTTAAHITCLHTGLEVGQSGVYEWQSSVLHPSQGGRPA